MKTTRGFAISLLTVDHRVLEQSRNSSSDQWKVKRKEQDLPKRLLEVCSTSEKTGTRKELGQKVNLLET